MWVKTMFQLSRFDCMHSILFQHLKFTLKCRRFETIEKGKKIRQRLNNGPEYLFPGTIPAWKIRCKDIPARRVRRWAFSLKELLKDPAGREQFFKFLEKEFSAENLKFWDAVQELKQVHSRDIPVKVQEIWEREKDMSLHSAWQHAVGCELTGRVVFCHVSLTLDELISCVD
ncbi:Regulator of G-protein signaling 7 [Araneus ventricosus]|uniref:Regulator of G-protein signaling 7 n=1 Tax=Araneus ventricosus TaxID=182803 RepID=A0A4Y2W5Q1_ARAVE|nr:Regulator of G-protein signaling 7 [Araneus ventricosus]